MTDLKLYESLMNDFGVGYSKAEEDGQILIVIEEGSEKVGGYYGFVTYFCFDSTGKFIEIKLYE